MYNQNCLSGIRRVTLITETPQNIVWSCQTASELLISVIRLLLLSPRAKTTECFTGFFFWRLCNAVRRWLHLGIPCYTSKLKQGRWAKDRAEWFGRKSKKSVLCDAMTWLRREVIHKQSECCFSTVRLCFAQTITKGKLNARLIR